MKSNCHTCQTEQEVEAPECQLCRQRRIGENESWMGDATGFGSWDFNTVSDVFSGDGGDFGGCGADGSWGD